MNNYRFCAFAAPTPDSVECLTVASGADHCKHYIGEDCPCYIAGCYTENEALRIKRHYNMIEKRRKGSMKKAKKAVDGYQPEATDQVNPHNTPDEETSVIRPANGGFMSDSEVAQSRLNANKKGCAVGDYVEPRQSVVGKESKDSRKRKKESVTMVGKATEDLVQDSNSATTTGPVKSESMTVNPPMAYGWVCPKCGRVNAPWKSTCDCSKGIAVPNTPPNTPPSTPFPLAPNYEPYIPHTPYYNPPVETPNPFDPYGPYKWGDAPGWWNKGPTCETKPREGKFVMGIEYPDGHIEKCPLNYFAGLGDPIPCSPSFTGQKPPLDPAISTSVSSPNDNIHAYNIK